MKVLEKIKVPLIILLLVAMVVGYYVYLRTRDTDNTDKLSQNDSVAAEILNKDLEKNYPQTAKSVVAFYSDILKIIYKEELTDTEMSGVVDQLRGLFDDELLAYNDHDTYALSLQNEIAEYQDADMYVTDYKVEDGYGIEYKTLEDGNDYAYVDVIYYVRSGKSTGKICEEFTLRKDDEGRWKMLCWKSVDSSNVE